MTTSPTTELGKIAERMLETGKDRSDVSPDRRRMSTLRRHGLLEYPNGYGLSVGAMEAIRTDWAVTAREADRYGSKDVAAKLRGLVVLADAWLAAHKRTPELRATRIGKLDFDCYYTMWEIVTVWKSQAAEAVTKKHLERLEKLGLVVRTMGGNMVVPPAAGLEFVDQHGDPFMSRQA